MDVAGIHAWMENATRELHGDYSMFHRHLKPGADELNLHYSDEDMTMTGTSGDDEDSSDDPDESQPELVGRDGSPDPTFGIPRWYSDQPFLYDGRMCLVSLPGFLLVLSIGGDLLLSEMTFGSLLVYLFNVAGEKSKAALAFVITFFICHITLLYSAFPLIWTSVFNVFLLFAINGFSVLTGAWCFLHFEHFRQSEARLVKIFETMLFGIYPGINVILLTWIIATMTTARIAPYSITIVGFVVLQFFLTPTPSSFIKPNYQLPDFMSRDVLEAPLVGVVATVYVMVAPIVYVIGQAASNRYHGYLMFLKISWVEFLFITSLSVCLATFMNIRQFLENEGVSLRRLVHIRWTSGTIALLLVSGLLQGYGFTIYLLPWLSLGVAVHAAFGVMVGRRKTKTWGLLAGVALVVLYLFVFNKLPWAMQYYLLSGWVHVSLANLLLLGNALLCVICVYSSVYGSPDVLGCLILLQSLALITSEKVLLASQIYTTSSLLISVALGIYFCVRLHHVGKLPWQHTWLSVSLHLSKLGDLPEYFKPQLVVTSGTIESAVSELALFVLCLLVTKIVIFDQKGDMSFSVWLFYVWSCGMVISLNTPFFLVQFYYALFGILPSIPQLMAFGTGLGACLVGKLSLSHSEAWFGARTLSVAMLVLTLGMIHLEPNLTTEWADISRWVFLLVLVGIILVTPVASYTNSTLILVALGQGLGFPMGFILGSWMFEPRNSFWLISCATYGLVLGFCADMALLSWRQVNKVDRKIMVLCSWSIACRLCSNYVFILHLTPGFNILHKGNCEPRRETFEFGDLVWLILEILRFTLMVPCCLMLLALEWAEYGSEALTLNSGLTKVTVVLTVISVILKGLSFRDQVADLTKSGEESISPLVHVGNVCTLSAFILLCLLQPISIPQLWYFGCSSVLLCLQRDQLLFRRLSRKNYHAPVHYVLSVALWVAALSDCPFWYTYDFWGVIFGFVEILIIFSILPIYAIFFTILWNNVFYLSDRIVVFFSPLCVLLYFISPYSTWVFATHALIVSAWLVKYRLPLHVDRSTVSW